MKRKATIGLRRPERRAEIVSAARRVIEQKGIEGIGGKGCVFFIRH
jgi:hypothetical protein